MNVRVAAILAIVAAFAEAFAPTAFSPKFNYVGCRSSSLCASSSSGDDAPSFFESIVTNAKTRIGIAKRSSSEGSGFKQVTAEVIAGEYDDASVRAEAESMTKSAPCVMFTWESSPACKRAIKAMELVGANVKIVRLDDPWDEGNPLRAELGKITGKSSVPSVWIGGKYIGGYDAGTDVTSPGMVDLAFSGKLKPMLEEAGALHSQVLEIEESKEDVTVTEVDTSSEVATK